MVLELMAIPTSPCGQDPQRIGFDVRVFLPTVKVDIIVADRLRLASITFFSFRQGQNQVCFLEEAAGRGLSAWKTFLGMAGALILSRSITRPLRSLTEAASTISGGNIWHSKKRLSFR